ncbi:Nucleoporin POM152 [Ceratocystis lukuohia]
MDSTPRISTGAFPKTPGDSVRPRRTFHQKPPSSAFPRPPSQTPEKKPLLSSLGGPAKPPPRNNALPIAPQVNARPSANSPVIPLDLLDGPQQRIVAFAVWSILLLWRCYHWVQLMEEDESSPMLFLWWVLVDWGFIFGLSALRIPWLELAGSSRLVIFAMHAIVNYMLMFNVSLPFQFGVAALWKAFFDSEIAISEHNVRVSHIIHNSSLIMGKQIINILPEGTAVLNRDQIPYCIGPHSKTVQVPIQFNGTIPVEIEFTRVDILTNVAETIKLSKKEVSQIVRQIRQQQAEADDEMVEVFYPVKKTGVYRLSKVLDEYKLEVQRHSRETYIVQCPKASIRMPDTTDRCIRDLSDLFFDVEGTPPLKIKYDRTINGKDRSFHFQSLQPDDFVSPMFGGAALSPNGDENYSWARSSKISVGVNESMTNSGEWEYFVHEVHDAFGNTINYTTPEDDLDHEPFKSSLAKKLTVKERPRARLNGCDLRNPLLAAKGKPMGFPVSVSMPGGVGGASDHQLEWDFSPLASLSNSGDHGDKVSTFKYKAKSSKDIPSVSESGLYTLRKVSSGGCEGEIEEPSSCMLINPMEPTLKVKSEPISDKCAGNSVGLRVDLDLMGTPPFVVRYDVRSSSGLRYEKVTVNGLRYQLDLRPTDAGHHTYNFKTVSDSVYKDIPLTGMDYNLEQDVKPAASAFILSNDRSACLDEKAEIDVLFQGEPPYNLEYEIVHEGRRKASKISGIETSTFTITTEPLVKGGEYIIALNSVSDKRGCPTFLKDQMKVSVRRQKPRVGFGFIESRRRVLAVENSKLSLPVRLQGEGPWTVSYRNSVDGTVLSKVLNNANDRILVNSKGIYELVDVFDKQCHGSVDSDAFQFEVNWFDKPELSLQLSETIGEVNGVWRKNDICEGDVDGIELLFKGHGPYHVNYDLKHRGLNGGNAVSRHQLDVPQERSSIALDTTRPGENTYIFNSLEDSYYSSDRNFKGLEVRQRINAKPSASFNKPGSSFKYCKAEQANENTIPMSLKGVAPFYVELEIKHHSGGPSEPYTITAINSNNYGVKIPREILQLGSQQVRIRTVRDARGCQRRYDVDGPSVQVHLYEAPAIWPLETREDYCVGERISYTLSGTPPFEITYNFNGKRVAKSPTTNFRRVAESPGIFTITGISDKASECQAAVNITKNIHPLPSVRISRGRQSQVDIHEGTEVEILFEFGGTPPFEFTYTRSTNSRKGHKSVVLETRHEVSYENTKIIRASQEGTYEVVAIKDRYCSYSTHQLNAKDNKKIKKL